MEDARVVIAEILRERGNIGEVLARSLSDVPGRMETLREARLRMPDGSDEAVTVESAWEHKGSWVLKFADIDSIDAAKRLRGADVWLPLENRGSLPEGQYFQSDLVGCKVLDQVDGRVLGLVEGFEQYGGPPLLAVKGEAGQVLIPFVPEICVAVDLQNRSISVELPEGLLDL
ncbi:MAG: ribosome maturation factor RimM [Bryobacteraceae bacterium]